MPSPETARTLEVSPNISPSVFIERLNDFALQEELTLYKVWINTEAPQVIQRTVDSIKESDSGTYVLHLPRTNFSYFVRFGYDYLEGQIHYSAVLARLTKKLPLDRVEGLEELSPRLEFHHRVEWPAEGDSHRLTAAPTSAELEFVGDDTLLAEFFEYLVTAIL